MMPAGIDVIRDDILKSFVVTPVVVIFDKASNRFLQVTRQMASISGVYPAIRSGFM